MAYCLNQGRLFVDHAPELVYVALQLAVFRIAQGLPEFASVKQGQRRHDHWLALWLERHIFGRGATTNGDQETHYGYA